MRSNKRWSAQLAVVLLCALGLKLYYSSASPDELRWILAPTTSLVQLLSGLRFSFESHAGYMSSDHRFLIAASCAGVNFLITASLMLTLRKLWLNRDQRISWSSLLLAAGIAFVATIITNTTRIYIALQLRDLPGGTMWMNGSELHRAEGIVVYFVFLLLLFMLTERRSTNTHRPFQILFPLGIYYGITIALPLLHGGYRQGQEFWEYSAFVFVLPLLVLIPFALFRIVFRCHEERKLSTKMGDTFRPRFSAHRY